MLGLRKRQRRDNDQPQLSPVLQAASSSAPPPRRAGGSKNLAHLFSCRGCGRLPIVGTRYRSLRHGYGDGKFNFCKGCIDSQLGPTFIEEHGPFKVYQDVLSRSSSEARRELEHPTGGSLFYSLLGSDEDDLLAGILDQLDARSLARLECTCQLFHARTSALREGMSIVEHAAMRRVRATCAPASIRRPKQWTRLLADMLPRPTLVLRSLLPGTVPLLRPLSPGWDSCESVPRETPLYKCDVPQELVEITTKRSRVILTAMNATRHSTLKRNDCVLSFSPERLPGDASWRLTHTVGNSADDAWSVAEDPQSSSWAHQRRAPQLAAVKQFVPLLSNLLSRYSSIGSQEDYLVTEFDAALNELGVTLVNMVAELRRVRENLRNCVPASATVVGSPVYATQVNNKVVAVDEAIMGFEQGLVDGLQDLGWLPAETTQDLRDQEDSIDLHERILRFLQRSLSACLEITSDCECVTVVDNSRSTRQQIPSTGVSVRAGHVLIFPASLG